MSRVNAEVVKNIRNVVVRRQFYFIAYNSRAVAVATYHHTLIAIALCYANRNRTIQNHCLLERRDAIL